MENIFKLKENGTTVRTEIVAGLTTFMTMAYIIALNPNLIVGFGQGAFGGFGADGAAAWNGVFRPPVSPPPSVCSAWPSWLTSPLPWPPAWA